MAEAQARPEAPKALNQFQRIRVPSVIPHDPEIADWGEKLVQQHMKDDCDINNIMDRYRQTGMITHVASHGPQYGDYTSADFHTAMTTAAAVQTMFNELPAAAREHYQHQPGLFLDAIQEDYDGTMEELHELGVAPRRAPAIPEAEASESPPSEPTGGSEEGQPIDPT